MYILLSTAKIKFTSTFSMLNNNNSSIILNITIPLMQQKDKAHTLLYGLLNCSKCEGNKQNFKLML